MVVLGVEVVVCWVCDMIVWSRLFCSLWLMCCVGCVDMCVVLMFKTSECEFVLLVYTVRLRNWEVCFVMPV